jgi:hypothetical protein
MKVWNKKLLFVAINSYFHFFVYRARLNTVHIELDLQIYLGSMCTAVLIGWGPATPPPLPLPPHLACLYATCEGAVSQDRRHLVVTPWCAVPVPAVPYISYIPVVAWYPYPTPFSSLVQRIKWKKAFTWTVFALRRFEAMTDKRTGISGIV